jgi:hypothetical protein
LCVIPHNHFIVRYLGLTHRAMKILDPHPSEKNAIQKER